MPTCVIEMLESRKLLAGTASISGYIYEDRNRNGVREGEGHNLNPAPYAYLDLNNNGVGDNGEPSEQAFMSGGRFQFTDLDAGVYHVRLGELGLNWSVVIPINPSNREVIVQVADGETKTGVNFGIAFKGSITGHVWSDKYGKGVRRYSEKGIPRRVVWIDNNADGIFDPAVDTYTRTNADGEYKLTLFTDMY